MGVRGNSAADAAVKDALIGDIELIPFWRITCQQIYNILELWQSGWDELPGNKLQNIPSFKTVCCLSLDKQKRINCDSPIAHWPFFTHSFFIEGWGTADVHRLWWSFNYWTYSSILTCSGLTEIRESRFTAQSLCVLFQDIPPEKILTFSKKSIFLEKFKFEMTIGCLCFTNFLSLVLKLYIIY